MIKHKQYSRFNLSESRSDINVLVNEYRKRIYKQYDEEECNPKSPFHSFAEKKLSFTDLAWLNDNDQRFFYQTPNEQLAYVDYLSETGFILCMEYSPDGECILCGHSSGLIQMRHGKTGVVMSTLRYMQFPPKPIYAIQFSPSEERVCYAACADGWLYRIEIPNISPSADTVPAYFIRADPALECLTMQFYGVAPASSAASQYISQRFSPLSLGICADHSRMVVGYADTSIKVYDIETQEAILTYKVHKLRLAFIPKKLQRMHAGQVCAVRCHAQNENMFASASWDNTLRVWDLRCEIGCVMTFEGVNVCHDSIDLNRDLLISGSWQPTEALAVWDLVAKKRQNVIVVQNRRPNVDGEYIYACRFWRSTDYNRKGKYAIIGGSGTNCVEVVNLHNRYIACSYPHAGSVLAVTSFQERIAFAGTAPVFNIVTFHDPKHENYRENVDTYEFSKQPPLTEPQPASLYEADSSVASYVGGG